jgi:teichuronic acid biosynthesis glycosyltransferase TuaC
MFGAHLWSRHWKIGKKSAVMFPSFPDVQHLLNKQKVSVPSYRVLLITSEWPENEKIPHVPFLVQQVKYLRQAGLDISVFHFRAKKNPLNYLWAWIRLRRDYNLKSYDLIHAHFGQSGLIAIPTKLPLVVTFHGSDLQGIWGRKNRYTFAGKILKAVSRMVATYAEEVILVSEHMSRFLPPKVQYHVVPGGVNMELFVPRSQRFCRERLGLPPNNPLILFSGTHHRKRYYLAEQAVKILRAEINAELLCVSEVSHEEMPMYLNAADVLLLTSKHEGSPTIVKEALACNCPVVSVEVGDLRERLSGVPGCFVCENESPSTIASALAKAITSKEYFESRHQVEHLDEACVSERIIQIYSQLLNK